MSIFSKLSLSRKVIGKTFLRIGLSIALVLASLSLANAQVSLEVIAITGENAPDGNGAFDAFDAPALNAVGQVAFNAELSETAGGVADDYGLFRGEAQAAIVQIAREGQSSPDANGSFSQPGFGSTFVSDFANRAINDSGQVLLLDFLTGTSGGVADRTGIFIGDGSSTPTLVARTGQASPDGNGVFSSLDGIALNNNGTAAFFGSLSGVVGGFGSGDGVFVSDGGNASSLVQLAREGQALPNGNGTFSRLFGNPSINDSGFVAFADDVVSLPGGFFTAGYFASRADGSFIQYADQRQATQNGASFSVSNSPTINDNGDIFFRSTLEVSGSSLIRADPSGQLTLLANQGQPAPDGNGVLGSFNINGLDPAVNNAGDAAFRIGFSETSGGLTDSQGILKADGTAEGFVQVARTGQSAPDGNGTFSSLNLPALNDAGQVVFVADLTDTAERFSDDRGLFFFDDTLGLRQVARLGDAFLGSTITSLDFDDGQGPSVGFNNDGQIAFSFRLSDGREGIAIANQLPSPGDYNFDGDVDIEDYQIFVSNFGSTTNLQADGNQDQIVSAADYTIWRDNLGAARAEAITSTSVPEPSCSVLALTLFLLSANGRYFRLTHAPRKTDSRPYCGMIS